MTAQDKEAVLGDVRKIIAEQLGKDEGDVRHSPLMLQTLVLAIVASPLPLARQDAGI